MDRKKTIVIAVAINAVLLVVLFIAAMTMEEESVSSELARAWEEKVEHNRPLFEEGIDLPATPHFTAEAPIELPLAVLPIQTEGQISHQLPPVAEKPTAPLPLSQANVQPRPQENTSLEIDVQRGDSLEKIAKKYQTSVNALMKLNQLSTTFLKIGQKLKIPTEKVSPRAAKSAAAAPMLSDATEYYTMKVGDNPWSVAMKHHLKVDELLKLNGLNEEKARKLKPGDRLRIR